MNSKIKDILSKDFSGEELQLLVGSYDVVGDIAIIIIPDSLVPREREIGRAILQNSRRIRVVAKRKGQYRGEFRTIDLEIIAGEKRKETMVVEFGVRLLLNPETVYYSVRSGNERKRIASLVQDGEDVLVLFSGIAPFPLMISRYSGARNIVAVEKNPAAHEYAMKNVQINRKCQNISLFHGDVLDVVPRLGKCFDRVVMVLPTQGEAYLPVALSALQPNGILHFYDMQKSQQFDDSVAKIMRVGERQNREIVSARVTKCGHCGPRTFRVCVDAGIT